MLNLRPFLAVTIGMVEEEMVEEVDGQRCAQVLAGCGAVHGWWSQLHTAPKSYDGCANRTMRANQTLLLKSLCVANCRALGVGPRYALPPQGTPRYRAPEPSYPSQSSSQGYEDGGRRDPYGGGDPYNRYQRDPWGR